MENDTDKTAKMLELIERARKKIRADAELADKRTATVPLQVTKIRHDDACVQRVDDGEAGE